MKQSILWVSTSLWPRVVLTSVLLPSCASLSETSVVDPKSVPSVQTWVLSRHQNGQPRTVVPYYLDRSGKKVTHGAKITHYEDGSKWRSIEYRHGKEHGRHLEWSKEGVLTLQGQWEEGLQQGEWTAWHAFAGLLPPVKAWQCTYRDGKISGKKTYWSPRLRSGAGEHRTYVSAVELYDKKGRKKEFTSYTPEGSIGIYGAYKNGKMHGEWTFRDHEGNIEAKGTYKYGKPWNGKCAVPLEEGSLFNAHDFAEFRNGRRVEKKSQ